MNIRELEEYISTQQKKIDDQCESIRENLSALLMMIIEQDILMKSHKEQTKSNNSRMLSSATNRTPGEINALMKTYRKLVLRNSIDRVFLESLNILETPKRRDKKTPKGKKSNLIIAGDSLAMIRSLKEKKSLTAIEKQMMKQMLKQLESEL